MYIHISMYNKKTHKNYNYNFYNYPQYYYVHFYKFQYVFYYELFKDCIE
jgi:hypothetical protein